MEVFRGEFNFIEFFRVKTKRQVLNKGEGGVQSYQCYVLPSLRSAKKQDWNKYLQGFQLPFPNFCLFLINLHQFQRTRTLSRASHLIFQTTAQNFFCAIFSLPLFVPLFTAARKSCLTFLISSLLFHSVVTFPCLRLFSIALFLESFIFFLTHLFKWFRRLSKNFRAKFEWIIDGHATTYFCTHGS